MARINKADHPRILQMVDLERRKVADVAAEFGCSPASIYTLLKKLRDDAAPHGPTVETLPADSPPTVPAAADAARLDLFGAAIPDAPATLPTRPPPVPAAQAQPVRQPPALAVVDNQPVRSAPVHTSGSSGTALKSGFGLAMRTAEGDESVAPFKSLDDLLSAIKPILRAAARSADPVWFSIQQIDLASIDQDAA